MVFDKPIVIEVMDHDTETWSEYLRLHAHVNKTKQTEFVSASAERTSRTLTFTIRFFKLLKPIAYDVQSYRIIYDGQTFNIVDYDDYQEQHLTVKLVGDSY